jgi:hypothetical protein
MSGVGNVLNTSQRQQQSGSPFTAGSARNGLSVDATGRIVLGQDVGAVGNPAVLLNNREVPMNGNTFRFSDAGNRQFFIDPVTNIYTLGNFDLGINSLFIGPGLGLFFQDQLGTPRLVIPDNATGISQMTSDDFVSVLQLANAANGGIASIGSSTSVAANSNNGQLQMTPGDGLFLHYLAALTNFAAANVGTLNNSPVAGNPTKWVRVDDNGVNRHIPMW